MNLGHENAVLPDVQECYDLRASSAHDDAAVFLEPLLLRAALPQHDAFARLADLQAAARVGEKNQIYPIAWKPLVTQTVAELAALGMTLDVTSQGWLTRMTIKAATR